MSRRPSLDAAPRRRTSAALAFCAITALALVFAATANAQSNKLAVGYTHVCAINSDSLAQCWGNNFAGQVGDGTTTDASTFTNVVNLGSGVTGLYSSFYGLSTCAIVSGAAQCWGYNGDGELGDGTTTDSSVPVNVTGLSAGVTNMATAYYYSCAVVSGAAKCWGYGRDGNLGDGNGTDSLSPVDVIGMASGVSQITVSAWTTTCGIQNGAAKCWGDDDRGQIGDGTINPSPTDTPVPVLGLSSGVTSIAEGQQFTCAVVSGAAKCWGANSNGQLGNGTTTDSAIPVSVSGLSSGVTSIAVGDDQACAIVSGAAKCWGANSNGQLGDGTTTDSDTPVAVSGLTSGVDELGGGYDVTCARVQTQLYCWGSNGSNQLTGYASGDYDTPQLLTPFSFGLDPESVVPVPTAATPVVGPITKVVKSPKFARLTKRRIIVKVTCTAGCKTAAVVKIGSKRYMLKSRTVAPSASKRVRIWVKRSVRVKIRAARAAHKQVKLQLYLISGSTKTKFKIVNLN